MRGDEVATVLTRGLAVLGTLVWGLALASDAPAAEEALELSTERGPLTVHLRLEPAQPVIGDVLELTLTVRAEPGVETLMPAFGEALERYLILEFVPREEIDDEGRTHATQRYLLQPARSGPQSIPPILVEFVDRRPGHAPASEGADAYELLSERLEFEVASVLPSGAVPDLRPALGPLPKRKLPTGPRWPWVVGALAALGAVSPFLVRVWIRWRARARRRSAYEIARARLDRLVAGARPRSLEEIDVFFVELSSTVRHYLEDHFELRSPELTTEEFLSGISGSPDLSLEHQRLLRDFLRRADLVKFAQHLPDEGDIQDSVRAAERFLDETRENAPLIEAPDLNKEAVHA